MWPQRSLLMAATLGTLAAPLAAQSIPDRATLAGYLGNAHLMEQFESYVHLLGNTAAILSSTLDQNTVIQTAGIGQQGPGLVEPGCTYTCPNGLLGWADHGFGGIQTQQLTTIPTANTIVIDYDYPVIATGLDVSWVNFLPPPLTGTVTFKDVSGAVIGTIPVSAPGSGVSAFAGWFHPAGIASVEIVSTSLNNSPAIDNHDYGIDPLHTAHQYSVGFGCYKSYASFSQFHTSFDLSNRSLRFDNVGSTYVVTVGTLPVAPTTAPSVAMQDDEVLTFPLGWTLPYPGGTTTDLYISSNGFLHLVPNASPTLNFLNSGPVIAAKAWNLDPSAGGTVTFEADPVAQTATITFDQVPDAGSNNANTFQYFFDSAGHVELRFGACAPTLGRTGWSRDNNNVAPPSVDISTVTVITPASADREPLKLSVNENPVMGTTVDLLIEEVPAASLATIHSFGATAITPSLNLAAVGMPDCYLHFSMDFLHLTAMPVGGASVYSLPVPNNMALMGQVWGVQGAALDPAGNHNALGLITSNGTALRIGL